MTGGFHSFLSQLPKCYSTGSCYIQRVHIVIHGDDHIVVAIFDGFCGQPITLSSQNNCEFVFCVKGRIIDGNGIVVESHCSRFEASLLQICLPIPALSVKKGPRNLENSTHANTDRAPGERITTGRCQQNAVHTQGSGTAKDRADIGGIHHTF